MSPAKKKVLFADEQLSLRERFSKLSLKSPLFEGKTCSSGDEVLDLLSTFSPDLCILDLLLPKVHGIELLKTIKKKNPRIGVIITSWEPMIQNYRAASDAGGDYFLDKPFTDKKLLSLIESFFSEGLQPAPFASLLDHQGEGKHCFLPKTTEKDSYIQFWGTRGSSPVSGPEYIRFGGNTSCLEIRHGKDIAIIDAGSGIRDIGNALIEEGGPRNIEILLSHTHLDHMGGFPSFAPLYDKDFSLKVRAPVGFYKNTEELFSDMLTHAFFPVDLKEVQADISFQEIRSLEPIQIGKITVEAHHTYHPGSTLGFKITVGEICFGYITDNEMLMGYHGDPAHLTKKDLLEPHASLIQFLKGCDFLVHEAQYTPETYLGKVGWGHSSISNATVLLKETGIKLWIVTHHDPSDSDDIIHEKYQIHQDLLEHCGVDCQVRMAYDGLKICF